VEEKLCYISVDVEASVGWPSMPPNSSMIALGACVIGDKSGDVKKRFYAEIIPSGREWDPEAEKIHGLSPKYLYEHGQYPSQVMISHCCWVEDVVRGAKPVFCALPVRFDYAHVCWYFKMFQVHNPYTEPLDIRELYRGLKGIPAGVEIPSQQIRKDFPALLPHTHNALDDALEQAEVAEGILRALGRL